MARFNQALRICLLALLLEALRRLQLSDGHSVSRAKCRFPTAATAHEP